MKSYEKSEEQVFNWLMNKHRQNPAFTFSLRKNASKGSELNYFLGTKKSNYFSTTFWSIHIGYPGISYDLIDFIIKIKENSCSYFIQFNQTRSPNSKQNEYALKFIQNLKKRLKEFRGYSENDSNSKMEYFQVGNAQKSYNSIEELIQDAEIDLNKVIPLIDEELLLFKNRNPEFKAEKINSKQFDTMLEKLKIRRDKQSNLPLDIDNKQTIDDKNETNSTSSSNMTTNAPLNQILFGPPGTGKTYHTINKAIEIINPTFDTNQSRDLVKKEFERLVKTGQIVFSTFHQSMSYEDFIEGLKPETDENHQVIYNVKPGVFKQLCEKADTRPISNDDFELVYKEFLEEIKKNDGKLILETTARANKFTIYINSKDNLKFHANTEKHYEGVVKKNIIEHYLKTNVTLDWKPYVKAIGAYIVKKYHYSNQEQEVAKNYVIIIDEINRGNVSQIFGELITLIEEDKRKGKPEALEVTLPYSKEEFSVPSNLYIIGTMNTADRSVEALDAALRRRFNFEEMPAKPEIIKTEGKAVGGMIDGIDLAKVLTTINKRIEILLDKDHQIGHSYFLCVSNEEELKTAFKHKILPLLQEYFFGDYGKIGLVLGKGFVSTSEKNQDHSTLFADFDNATDLSDDFEDKTIYEINPIDKNFDISSAIESLLND